MAIDIKQWNALLSAARERLCPRVLSPFVEAGGVAAAVLSERGGIYTGVCIDTACSLGMCAERNAVANMITCGESRIKALVCVMGNGAVGFPCGACRELLMQIDACSADIEILTGEAPYTSVRLGELVPDWWGVARMRCGMGDSHD